MSREKRRMIEVRKDNWPPRTTPPIYGEVKMMAVYRRKPYSLFLKNGRERKIMDKPSKKYEEIYEVSEMLSRGLTNR